jgi:hypothetical protein
LNRLLGRIEVDKNLCVITESNANYGLEDLDASRDGYADALKISGIEGTTIEIGQIIGGIEDCIDVNRSCKSIKIFTKELIASGKYVATIKGGSSYIELHGHIRRHGSEVDIDIGNWSDQSNDPTKYVILNLTADNGPVTVRVLSGTEPIFLNSEENYRFLFPDPRHFYHGIVVTIFKFMRRIGFFR